MNAKSQTVPTDRNADPAELAQFNSQAEHWWDTSGPMGALHQINPLRLQVIEGVTPLQGARVADIGCGGGILAEAMSRRGAQVTGLDLSSDVLSVARKHAESEQLDIHYVERPAEDFAAENAGQFDLVTCMEMLEHVPAPESVVVACAALLKPGGHVVFSTLNRHPMSFLQAIIGAEYVLGMVPRGTHQYTKFIRPSELARGCRDAGLTLGPTRGLSYNPLTRAFRLNQDLRVNYFLTARKPKA